MSKILIGLFIISLGFSVFLCVSLSAPKPQVPPDTVDWQCRATAKIQVCELQLGDGTRCVVTDKGGVACEWGGR